MSGPSSEPFDAAAFIDLMSQIVDVPIPPEHRDGVIANFERIHAVAQVVMDFPLPESIEPAPRFEP